MKPNTNAQKEIKKVIYVIDRDTKMRQRINDIFAPENVDVKTFSSGEDFLAQELDDHRTLFLVIRSLTPRSTGLSHCASMPHLEVLSLGLRTTVMSSLYRVGRPQL